jgi:hypothetical protein
MTLLTLANTVQDRIGLPRSSVVISSTDQNVRTLLACLNEEGKELSKRAAWQALTKEKTFTSTAAAVQTGAIPTDLDRFVNETFFNRSMRRRVTGPLTSEEWQAQQSIVASVLTDAFRVHGNDILITPTPAASLTYAYEYVSKYWVDTDGDGDGDAVAWEADDDTSLLSEDLMALGAEWRFLKRKGFDYAEIFRTYEIQVQQAISRDGARRTTSMAGGSDLLLDNARYPAVPEGSWSL